MVEWAMIDIPVLDIQTVEQRISPGFEITSGGCWLWKGCQNRNGYCQIGIRGKYYMIHRLLYRQLKGVIPTGYCLDHICRTRNCVNPEHLEAVTWQENIKRGLAGKSDNALPTIYKTRTRCGRGHPYTSENTYTNDLGHRYCRLCKQMRKAKHYAKADGRPFNEDGFFNGVRTTNNDRRE